MKKTYIRPSFTIFNMTGASLMVTSVRINSDAEGNDMDTRKKSNTDMWGNDNNKGIWD